MCKNGFSQKVKIQNYGSHIFDSQIISDPVNTKLEKSIRSNPVYIEIVKFLHEKNVEVVTN